MSKTATKTPKKEMWSWSKHKNLCTGFYTDTLEDKKIKSSTYSPNVVLITRVSSRNSMAL